MQKKKEHISFMLYVAMFLYNFFLLGLVIWLVAMIWDPDDDFFCWASSFSAAWD